MEKEDGLISYHQYQNLVDSINDVIFQTDLNRNWSFLNNSWKRVMGFQINEVIGKPLFQFLHPDDVEMNFRLFEALKKEEKGDDTHEIRFIAKSGKIVWMKMYAILLTDDKGGVIGTSGTLQDITRDKQNRDMVKLLSDNITDLICVHGTDGTYKYVSPSSKATTGYLPEELIDKTPYIFFHPDDIKPVQLAYDNSLKKEIDEEFYTSYRFCTKGGNYKWFETSSKIIRDENSLPLGLVTSSRVIDQRKEAEGLILKSLQNEQALNQLKSSFVSLASHEFRTPLACIRSSIELVEICASRAKEPIPAINRHTKNVFSEVDRLSALIDEVLTVGKIESQSLSCKKEPVDVVNLINGIIGNIHQITEDSRKIVFKKEGALRPVMADSLLLNHVITNLLSNALKYSPGKTNPIITLIFENNNYAIKVKDFGIGIPAKEHDKIFQAFYRAENAFSMQGTGLGMFITKNFVELHNGTISFNSAPTKGTEFTVRLN